MKFPKIVLKITALSLLMGINACGQKTANIPENNSDNHVVVGANKTDTYLQLLERKRVAVIANPTSVIFKNPEQSTYIHLIDSLLSLKVNIVKVFSPEHGFRGEADAGEKVVDGKDIKTGLPLLSLYGKNRKPQPEQLKDVDILLFDIQDVGVRFYTYIATLQLVMEAAADAGIDIVLLDRPNPNGHYIDGPVMEKAHTSFLGMTEIPLVYGMTIGEYAQMINEEGWLPNEKKASLTVIPLDGYSHQSRYVLPIRPSPNLPNAQSINLYPSLGLFEGTTVNAGRGTDEQFQRFGASFLDSIHFPFSYTPEANFGAKTPKEKGLTCYGRDLSTEAYLSAVHLEWIIEAYEHCGDRKKFFITNSFTKHAGTELLQRQIENGASAEEIYLTWKPQLEKFKEIRKKYLLYPDHTVRNNRK